MAILLNLVKSTCHPEQRHICLWRQKRVVTSHARWKQEANSVRERSFGVGFRDNQVSQEPLWKEFYFTSVTVCRAGLVCPDTTRAD